MSYVAASHCEFTRALIEAEIIPKQSISFTIEARVGRPIIVRSEAYAEDALNGEQIISSIRELMLKPEAPPVEAAEKRLESEAQSAPLNLAVR